MTPRPKIQKLGKTGKLLVRERDYLKLIDNAVQVMKNQEKDVLKATRLFRNIDNWPTVEMMEEWGIGPYDGSRMDMYILAYLIFYCEQYCTDEENDEWEYIYQPDPEYFTKEEYDEFLEARRYMERTIIKRVERI